ncbi:MAG: excinuclease ABC subunit UvrA [Deltaproteobacteria bacterium]|nr:excinuclease ABC subunit UvrA [Deltaproteobacteria bacterium]
MADLAAPASGPTHIVVRGAREHNLRGIDVSIPRDRFVVITGLSGSGKSSLAFDTLYAEGQRRYVESLSAYARQFLDQMSKPEVESIEGLSPAISIEQRTIGKSPRSTVGTVTEVYDYLRLLWARVGTPHCWTCGQPIARQTVQQMTDRVLGLGEGVRVQVLAPVVRGRKGTYKKELDAFRRQGFVRARIDGELRDLSEEISLGRQKTHEIDLVVDRVQVKESARARIAGSIETALRLGAGLVRIESGSEPAWLLSEANACARCGVSFPEIAPRSFSFNSPHGACPRCDGLGVREAAPPPRPHAARGRRSKAAASERGDAARSGAGQVRSSGVEVEADAVERICEDCGGARLSPQARSVRLGGLGIHELTAKSIDETRTFLERLALGPSERTIADRILAEILDRLRFLEDVGVAYLTLDRPSASLSGGEAQRIRLATQVGASLMGVLYILDEPSIGLHARDNERLLQSLLRLRDSGNSVIVVEHDEATIRRADWVIDMGPGAGIHGGEIVAAGSPRAIEADPRSLTGAYLRGARGVRVPERRKPDPTRWLTVTGCREHNLRDVTLRVPLGLLTVVTGVSGSGKSTLVNDILHRALAQRLHAAKAPPGRFAELRGAGQLDKVVDVDQTPIGRTPRSNPATYTGIFDDIRALFARVPEARMRGYGPGRFSFNVKGGRCESCEGDGLRRVEMSFLPDLFVTCEICGGRRYNRETLEIRFKGRSIADVLEMPVEEALGFFENVPRIQRILQTLHDVGLDYLHLGQQATTLSGGEAQRIKLARELSRRGAGRTLYLLDEPTTGLHFADVEKLLELLQRLVALGNTVVVIEHHLDVIKSADFVVDLGPDGGFAGGAIVAEGTPEEVARVTASHTGRALATVLGA